MMRVKELLYKERVKYVPLVYPVAITKRLTHLSKWLGLVLGFSFSIGVMGADVHNLVPNNISEWEDQGWQHGTSSKDDSIVIYTQREPNSRFKAFRAITKINASIKDSVALLNNAQRMPQWLFKCQSAVVLDKASDSETIWYLITDMPWPTKDRDTVMRSKIVEFPEQKGVQMIMSTESSLLAKKSSYIRVEEMRGIWQFRDVGSGVTEVIYEAHADPGGSIPSWLANSFVVEAPMTSLQQFRKVVQNFSASNGLVAE